MLRGTVTEFDAERGLGEVSGDDGGTYPFHVIEIADGTRTIDVDQRVAFDLLAKFGGLQAASIHTV